jgi:hypothetical protein
MRQPQEKQSESSKRPPTKEEATPKNAMGLIKRPPMKKEATPGNAKGLTKKTSDEE